MTDLSQTVFRFAGALLLAAGATVVDHRGLLVTPGGSELETVPVVVASKDIGEGMIIDQSALTVARWPVEARPAGAYASIDSVAHRVSRITIHKGEAIVPGRLAPRGATAGLEVRLTPGKRAFSIRINNDPATMVDQVQPNSRVDVMLVIDDPDNPGKRVAKLFMSNMRVLAIGRVVQRSPFGQAISPILVTIEVTPYEAEALAVAVSRDQLSIVPTSPEVVAAAMIAPDVAVPVVPAGADIARVPDADAESASRNRDIIAPALTPTPGKRSFTFTFEDRSFVARHIEPGGAANALLIIADREHYVNRLAKLLTRNLRVLDIRTTLPRAIPARAELYVATVEVTDEEAEKLGIAERRGGLSLVPTWFGDQMR